MSVLGGRTAAGTPRRADIQGLRALAVLLVVAFHAGLPVPGGFMGVDVFFAISGFVITTMLLSELEILRRDRFPPLLPPPRTSPAPGAHAQPRPNRGGPPQPRGSAAHDSAHGNGTIIYRDADHLSVEGSLTLTDRFYRAIEALAR